MKTDVLILGGGLAGFTAAREALGKNLRVLLAEDGYGASPWVHGFNCPVLPGDSPELFLQDTLQSGQGLSEPKLAEALCGDARKVLEELREEGLGFNRDAGGEYRAIRPLGASCPRVISIGNETGTAILKRFEEETEGRLVRLSRTRGLRLLKEGNRVCGALLFDGREKRWISVFARAVVLCTGGFCGIFPVTTNKRDSGGDGIAMAFEAGAELCDLEFIQFEPSASVWPPALNGTSMITTLFFEGAVLRNGARERFMLRYGENAERVGKDVLARCIAEEIAAGRGTEHGGVYMDCTGVDPDVLDRDYAMYVERYRNVGIDLKRQMIELAPASHTALGGLRTDERGRTSLEGLFACGEATGGLHGANRLGGSGGLEPLVFGHRAGRSAAAWAEGTEEAEERETEIPECGKESISGELEEIRREMQRILREAAGVIRTETGLSAGLARLKSLRERAWEMRGRDEMENFRLLRMRNDLTAAELLFLAARERRETVGCHIRADYPERAEQPERILLRKAEDGRTEVFRRRISE